ncbi:hypothetical protein LRS06_15705 [Hymenobacter sp. J193]|uniref:PEP/pyruvate-binding domain-containing protein n=1 Tax=Hymenobacter sp. J193 TaxID=2898429 RepID=UPI002150978B|nr:PEP/pyruvate-binding domain-containing protein [Hymenobacter sp. J193]MCR5889183.1 hypothetical protein [Hymenobacter sp. J193]
MLLPDSLAPGAAAIGGKAAGLFRLRQLGVAVPPFAVLPADAFAPLFTALPAASDADLDTRQASLLAYEPTPEDRAALRVQLTGWDFPARPVAVRSSVADEDGAGHSFAGLMDSFLNLTSEDEIWAAVARCAASAYSVRARAYRRQRGLPLAARPAVVVQAQVAALTSGVLFSTWPEYPMEMTIHALWGFGEALVSGAQQPDEFYLRKATGELTHQQLADKAQRLAVVLGAAGLHQAPVAAEEQLAPSLSPAELTQLHTLGQQLETAMGGPQDVEFVVDEADRLWVVQARPITQPIPELLVFDNSNIQESYCGVTTPLTFSFARRAYATVYRQTMRALGVPAAEVEAHEPVVTQLLVLVQGRIYYHINHWYRGLLLLPSFQQNKADMERMMGLEEPVDFVQPPRRSRLEQLRSAPRLAANLLRLLAAFASLRRAVPAFHARLAAAYQRFYTLPLAQFSGAELLAEKTRLDEELLSHWTTPIINDFRVMMANGRALRNLRAAGVAEPEDLLRRYLASDQQLASVQPVHRLLALARQAHTHTGLPELIQALPADVAEQVAASYPQFEQAARQFREEFGDRTVGELKLETATMRTQPRIFYQYLRNLVAVPPAATAANPSGISPSAATDIEALLNRLPRLRRWALTRSLTGLQEAIRHREALRLERTRLFGMYRSLYRAAGERLTQAGHLFQPEDVFMLTENEIAEALTGTPATPAPALPSPAPGIWLSPPPAHTTDLPALVAARQQEFARYEQLAVPARVTVPAAPVRMLPAAVGETDGVLRGTGCYPGVVEGEALVVRRPEDDLNVAGKIVCALRTDPGWATLFPACRAVAIEKGSSLSHSVIILRELGIPTIINVPGLTQQLQSGQRVVLDGQCGTLQLLPATQPAAENPSALSPRHA